MPTARCWTELRHGVEDLGALLRLRSTSLDPRARRRLRGAGLLLLALTVLVVLGPAYLVGEERPRAGAILAVLPSMSLVFLGLAAVSAAASGGGRELVPREQLVAYPVDSTAEHFGALLLAPLNIGWLLQAWALLGATSYALGPQRWWAYQLPMLLWIVVATALGQVVGWLVEGVRRGPHGIAAVRVLAGVVAALGLLLAGTGSVTAVLDRSPTRALLFAVLDGSAGRWSELAWALGALLVAVPLVVLAGVVPARWALGRPMREELRLEAGRHPARRDPRTDFAMVLRVDRASVLRSVPLRRGLLMLALLPGLVAVAGSLEWRMLTILPGLVASGAALLFGVNTWCLDGRGALWRESLPLVPQVAFWSRAWVLGEVLVGAGLLTAVLGASRAGAPTGAELAAVLAAVLVVSIQVVGASMRWSIRRPFAVDLRSARATPAPPVVMASYSARLALVTTLTGLVFYGAATLPGPQYPVALALPMLAWSAFRLARSAKAWDDPVRRAVVVTTVSA